MPSEKRPLKIVTMHPFEPHEIEQIKVAAPHARIDFTVCQSREEFDQQSKAAEVVYGDIRGEALRSASKLKWVQAGGAGLETLDPALREHPAILTNFASTFAPAISETAIGMLLCLTRGISRHYVPQFCRREWKPVGTVKSADHVEISGRTMGIVGLGGIGAATARRAHYGFDMRIVATDARPIHKPAYVAELRDLSWFQQMVPQVDVLVAAAPHTPQTERMFNEQVFRSMKKTAYFLALSRGKLFDDMALVRALKEGWIAGAGLDVFPQEPPPADHPIFDCPNVVITAHTSGWSPDRQIRLVELFAENVRRYTEGLPPINVVDKKAGY
jgi:phosphoglycerate dehydrogenase-like enzyme